MSEKPEIQEKPGIPQVPERYVRVIAHANLGDLYCAPDLSIKIGMLTLALGEKFAVVLGDWRKEERNGQIVTVYTSQDKTVCPPEIIQAAVRHNIMNGEELNGLNSIEITVEDITE